MSIKPKRWLTFWATPDDGTSRGSKCVKPSRHDGVLAFDMIVKESDLYRIIGAITMPPTMVAPIRSYCMHCKVSPSVLPSVATKSLSNPTVAAAKMTHCRHCCRSVCTNCCRVRLPSDYFGKNFRNVSTFGSGPPPLWPCCVVCEKILVARKEITSHGTQPTTTTTIGSGSINDFLFESYDDKDDTDRYSC